MCVALNMPSLSHRSVAGVCLAPKAGSVVASNAPPYIIMPDTIPPVITLLGTGTLGTAADGTPVLNVSMAAGGVTYLDPGATATDYVDGNITSQLSVVGGTPYIVDTRYPTLPGAPHVVRCFCHH
jgi:hypothetical protein